MTNRSLALFGLAAAMASVACAAPAAGSMAQAVTEQASVIRPAVIAQLRGADTVAGDLFGSEIAGTDATIVVGAQDHSRQAGRAYVFARRKSGWRQIAELAGSGSRPGANFGDAVAIAGTTIVIGAGGAGSGRAYVFTKTAAGWQQTSELAGRSLRPGDGFGDTVAITGSTIFVGADGADQARGRVFVFARRFHGWVLTGVLQGSGAGGRPSAGFGRQLAISGSEAIVSAPIAETVYIFAKTRSGWAQTAVLPAPPSPGGDGFAQSVGISGRTAAVGAVQHGGRVYVYSHVRAGWRRSAQLSATGPGEFDLLGSAIGLAGPLLVATAPQADASAGRAYVFYKTRTGWRLANVLKHRFVRYGVFGYAAAIWNHTIAVGQLGNGPIKGEIYVYKM